MEKDASAQMENASEKEHSRIGARGRNHMITLYHCAAARSFRPLWTLEELGLAYDLKMLPFPPRVFAKEYLGINPLGTIPLLLDGDTRMTESAGSRNIW